MVPPEKVRRRATSIATTPPVEPFQARALTVPATVASRYCGTSITWKLSRALVSLEAV